LGSSGAEKKTEESRRRVQDESGRRLKWYGEDGQEGRDVRRGGGGDRGKRVEEIQSKGGEGIDTEGAEKERGVVRV